MWLSILWLPAVATHLLVMPYINSIQFFMYKTLPILYVVKPRELNILGRGFGLENNLPPYFLASF